MLLSRKVLRVLRKKKVGRDILRFISASFGKGAHIKYPVVLSSIPKAGTNMLKNVVLSIPGAKFKATISRGKNIWGLEALWMSRKEYFSLIEETIYDLRGGMTYVGHNPYTPEVARWFSKWGIKHILIVRDPRDYVISLARYVSDPSVNHIRAHTLADADEAEKILRAIQGVGEGKHSFDMSWDSIPNVSKIYEVYEGWLYDKNTLVLKYEDFVGEKGVSENIKNIVRRICEYLEVDFDEDTINYIIKEGMKPEKSHTFRVGRSGQWKQLFRKEHYLAFKKVGGEEILLKFGYN